MKYENAMVGLKCLVGKKVFDQFGRFSVTDEEVGTVVGSSGWGKSTVHVIDVPGHNLKDFMCDELGNPLNPQSPYKASFTHGLNRKDLSAKWW